MQNPEKIFIKCMIELKQKKWPTRPARNAEKRQKQPRNGEFIETNYVWCDDQDARMFDVKEYVTDAYKKYIRWAIANDKGTLTLKQFDNKVGHSGNIEVRTENENGKKYYRNIIFEPNP